MTARTKTLFERWFEIEDDPVLLRLEPVESWGDTDFKCRFTIIWPDAEFTNHAGGVDSLQAFLMALQAAHLSLLTLRGTQRNAAVTWLGAADLGLPLPAGVTASDFSQPA